MGIKVCLGGGRGKSVSGEGREEEENPGYAFRKYPRASLEHPLVRIFNYIL